MNGTVLVLDDEAAVLEFTALFLTKNGFTTYIGRSAAAAAQKFQEAGYKIDFLVADLKLPDAGGIEVAVKLTTLAPGLKTIIVSGHGPQYWHDSDLELLNQLPPRSVGFLSKPYSGQDLLTRIHALSADRSPAPDIAATSAARPPSSRRADYETQQGQAELLDLVHDAIIARSLDGHIHYWNRGAEILYGWNKDEVRGRIADRLLHTVYVQPVEDIVAILQEKQYWEGELYQTVKDGGIVVVSSRWTIRKGENDEVEIFEFTRDISAQKRVEEGFRGVNREMQLRIDELHRAEQMFRSLIESAPDAMVITDRSGQIVLVNGQTEKQFGYLRDELLGQRVEMLVPERFRSRHPIHRAAYANEPRVRPMGDHGELFGLHKNGEEFPVEISLSAIDTGSNLLICSSIRDLTDRRRS